MKKLISMLLILTAGWTMTACAGRENSMDAARQSDERSTQKDAQDTANPSVLVYGSQDYTRINPALDEHGEINVLIFDGLTAHNGDNEVVPGLAKRWEFDSETNTYTFELEEDVRWHDGEEFTAQDVKFTIEAIMDPENDSENAPDYEDVEEITVMDTHTIAFRLAAANVAFLDYMTMPILPEQFLRYDSMIPCARQRSWQMAIRPLSAVNMIILYLAQR